MRESRSRFLLALVVTMGLFLIGVRFIARARAQAVAQGLMKPLP